MNAAHALHPTAAHIRRIWVNMGLTKFGILFINTARVVFAAVSLDAIVMFL